MLGEFFAGGASTLALILDLWLVGGCLVGLLWLADRFVGGAPRFRYGLGVVTFLAAVGLPLWDRPTHPVTEPAAPVGLTGPFDGLVQTADGWGLTVGLPVLWLTVAAGLVVREIHGHRSLRRRRNRWPDAPAELRRALRWPADVPLVLSGEAPCTVGLFRPCVALPAAWIPTWRTGPLRAVAAHECDHARWRDPLVHAGLRLLRALFWPSLPLWWLERWIRTRRELAADAAALAGMTDRGDRAEYARAVLLAASRSPWAAANPLGSAAGVRYRIEQLFQPPRQRPSGRLLALGILIAGTWGIPATPATSPPSPVPTPLPLAGFAAADQRSAAALNEVLLATHFRDHTLNHGTVESIARITASGSVEPVRQALGHPDPRTRESAAWVAGVLGDRRLRASLEAARADANPHVRSTASWALGAVSKRGD